MLVQPLLQWKSNNYYIFWVCICSVRYPACNAHAPLCHLWSAWLYNIFPHYLINSTIKKKVIEHKMCVLIFSTTSVRNISLSKKNSARYYKKCTVTIMQSTCYSCPLLRQHDFLDRFFKKTQISNFIKIHPVRAELFHVDSWTNGQTDRHEETNSCFSHFCECTY
jgi:hypothetical protein